MSKELSISGFQYKSQITLNEFIDRAAQDVQDMAPGITYTEEEWWGSFNEWHTSKVRQRAIRNVN